MKITFSPTRTVLLTVIFSTVILGCKTVVSFIVVLFSVWFEPTIIVLFQVPFMVALKIILNIAQSPAVKLPTRLNVLLSIVVQLPLTFSIPTYFKAASGCSSTNTPVKFTLPVLFTTIVKITFSPTRTVLLTVILFIVKFESSSITIMIVSLLISV